MGLTHVGPRNHVLDGGPDTPREGALDGDVPAYSNIPMYECIVPAVGVCACPAHVVDDAFATMRRNKTRQQCGLLPNYFGHMFTISKFDRAGFLIFGLVFVSHDLEVGRNVSSEEWTVSPVRG